MNTFNAFVLVMEPHKVHEFLEARRRKIAGEKVSDFGAVLCVGKSQASSILTGRIPFGTKMIQRFNDIDPDFELVQLVAVVAKDREESTVLFDQSAGSLDLGGTYDIPEDDTE